MRFWNGPQLLICDELGYLPLPAEAASHFFQVVSRRHQHGSIILTSNRGTAPTSPGPQHGSQRVDPDRLRPKTARSTPPTSNAPPEAVAAESAEARCRPTRLND
jgi:IstB-like ATP binding protein